MKPWQYGQKSINLIIHKYVEEKTVRWKTVNWWKNLEVNFLF